MGTVCFCNSTLAWGGGEVWHYNAATSLAGRGWRVFMLCHPGGRLYARLRDEADVTPVPAAIGRLSFLNPFLRRRLVGFFRKERIDSLIMNLPSDLKCAGPAARQAGVPNILYRRGSALPVRNSALNRHLYGKVISGLIVNSLATRDMVLVNNPGLVARERIFVIPNGFDRQGFDRALAGARDCFFVGPAGAKRPLVIGNAGRLDRQKAQHLVLRLGAILQGRGLDVRLLIAGTGALESRLRDQAEGLGIADKTCFAGFLEDMSPFWKATDVFVLTSLWEGFGNVVIEAGLAGKPVFCFAVSNLPELVRDGVNGRLFPIPESEKANLPGPDPAEPGGPGGDSLEAMADALEDLTRAPEKLRAMGAAGRAMALEYDQDTCMDKLEALLGAR